MNRAGEYISALYGEAGYQAYKPNPLPPVPPIELDTETVTLLSTAHSLLGRLDVTSSLIPNIDLFLGAYVRKEALLSSQIEGTQATLEDVLDPNVEASQNIDVNDVINYVKALNFALEEMHTLPLCNRLLCDTHRVLMQGVRGQEKSPGEFRRSQNWIGGVGSTIKTARYVPPTVENMHEAMGNIEKYIHSGGDDILIKTALVHYQFETVHPFLDGNGRIGRMLIILMLLSAGILKLPVLYMSLFLKRNRIEYYDRLGEVRVKGNYEQWIDFFLKGIVETCEDSISAIEALSALVTEDGHKISEESAKLKTVFEYVKAHPIINIGSAAKDLNISYNTVSTAIKKLCDLKILRETTSKSRGRVYEYSSYINILKEGI